MAGIEDVFKGGNILTGVAVGISVLFAAPLLRPLAKTVIKTGLLAYDQGRMAFAELTEQTSDIMAEARHELAEGAAAREEEEREAEQARTIRVQRRAATSTPPSPTDEATPA